MQIAMTDVVALAWFTGFTRRPACCTCVGKYAVSGYFQDNGAASCLPCLFSPLLCPCVKLRIEWVAIISRTMMVVVVVLQVTMDVMKECFIRLTHKAEGSGVRDGGCLTVRLLYTMYMY